MARPLTILLADDHVMFRRGVRRIIQGIDQVEVVGEASDGFELLELLKKTAPDLVILDISMPNLRGLEAAREIKVINPIYRPCSPPSWPASLRNEPNRRGSPGSPESP
jgi:DNA-binding NarL/FixJ family response regulator